MKRSTVSSTHCCIQRSAHTVPTVWVIACPKKPHASSTGHNPSITKLQMTFTAESHNSLVHHLVIKKKYTQFPLCYRVRSSASVRMPTVSLRVATLKTLQRVLYSEIWHHFIVSNVCVHRRGFHNAETHNKNWRGNTCKPSPISFSLALHSLKTRP